MKKTIFTLSIIIFVLVLTACNSSTSGATVEDSVGNAPPEVEREFNMPIEMQLMLGTVKLDETEYAVDAEQASQLLPLWKALRSLGESETAAQAEIEAVIAQIEDTMTPEQISAIEAMELTMEDAVNIAEAFGIEMGGFGGRMGEITPEMQATMEAARESGQIPGGGPGGGMGLGGGVGGAEMDPAARETAMAERGGVRGAGFGVNTIFLDTLIEFLEAKTQ